MCPVINHYIATSILVSSGYCTMLHGINPYEPFSRYFPPLANDTFQNLF